MNRISLVSHLVTSSFFVRVASDRLLQNAKKLVETLLKNVKSVFAAVAQTGVSAGSDTKILSPSRKAFF